MPVWSTKAHVPIAYNFAIHLHCFLITFKSLKILAVILSLYVACLSFAPCHDQEHEDSHNHFSVQSSHEHPEDNEDDGCSPFCVCSCFQIHIEVAQDYMINSPVFHVSSLKSYNFYNDVLSKPYYNTLFHPPIGSVSYTHLTLPTTPYV